MDLIHEGSVEKLLEPNLPKFIFRKNVPDPKGNQGYVDLTKMDPYRLRTSTLAARNPVDS